MPRHCSVELKNQFVHSVWTKLEQEVLKSDIDSESNPTIAVDGVLTSFTEQVALLQAIRLCGREQEGMSMLYTEKASLNKSRSIFSMFTRYLLLFWSLLNYEMGVVLTLYN